MRNSTESSRQLGRIARERRKLLGLTQEELSLLSGAGDVFIYHFETGKPTVRLDKVLAILTTLGLQLKVETGNEGIVDGIPKR